MNDVILIDTITQELRVHKVIYTEDSDATDDEDDSTLTVPYYKTVVKDYELLFDPLSGYGAYTQTNTSDLDSIFHDVYIAGTSFNRETNDTDYYIAKFNTKWNLTEWYRHSGVSGLNETVKGLLNSPEYDCVFIAVEVNSNTYMGSGFTSAYANSDWLNQTNIAVVAY